MNDNLRATYASFYLNSSYLISGIKKYIPKKYPELEREKEREKKPFFFSNKYIKSKKLQSRYEITNFGSGHFTTYLTAIDVWLDIRLLEVESNLLE